MALSDCIHCWNTPCTCGYEYRNWTREQRIELAAVILGVEEDAISSNVRVPRHHPKFESMQKIRASHIAVAESEFMKELRERDEKKPIKVLTEAAAFRPDPDFEEVTLEVEQCIDYPYGGTTVLFAWVLKENNITKDTVLTLSQLTGIIQGSAYGGHQLVFVKAHEPE